MPGRLGRPFTSWAAPWQQMRSNAAFRNRWNWRDATWVVASEAETGLRNGYDHPTRLGADRWVAMIGAYHRMRAQGEPRPMVVVMVGTAVTVEAIDAEGSFWVA